MTERRIAPGGPGLPPRWTRGAKEAVGTAYSSSSRVWYTVAAGVLTECFYPTIDTPQIRDLQFLVTDGHTDWQKRDVSVSTGTSVGVWYVDIVAPSNAARLRFTMTEGGEYSIDVTR
jgi:GH15 family glucan-1,4-alpha-glucosidase